MSKGFLIVIDGTDGSGKRTQSKLLISRLETHGQPAVYFDFPRHGMPSAAMVDEYLNGKFGSAKDVNPFAASIFYAVDRFAAAPEIREVMDKGHHAICDRYVSANMGHQSGKITNLEERDTYLSWLDNLEYGPIFGIPRPDVNILLYVPVAVSHKLVDKKDWRAYLSGKKRDIHENDIQHLEDAAQAFLYCAKKYGWIIIDCAPDGEILPELQISDLIWEAINKKIKFENEIDLPISQQKL